MSLSVEDLLLPVIIGGVLIGLGATLSWVLSGRHIGVAKCLPAFEQASERSAWWCTQMFVGLPAGGVVGHHLVGGLAAGGGGGSGASPLLLVGAGILAGAGMRLFRGDLIGYTVCGLAQQSPRSALAVAILFAAAFATGVLASRVLPL